MLRDLVRSSKNKTLAQRFVKGEIGIRNLINQVQSETLRSQLYRLERNGVSTARSQVRAALKNAR